jgi:hypothetical protein
MTAAWRSGERARTPHGLFGTLTTSSVAPVDQVLHVLVGLVADGLAHNNEKGIYDMHTFVL